MKLSVREVDEIKNWFAAYVEGFKHGSESAIENTVLKENHTRRVCGEILAIGRSLSMTPDALRLAEVTALLHDVGRFEQYRRYGTFVDGRSVNHAGLGVEIVQSHKVLKSMDETLQNLILRVIACHNRASLPEDESGTFLFFTRLLRDADKLDIYKVVTDYYAQTGDHRNKAIELDLADTDGFSDDVFASIMARRVVDIRHLKNFNDFKLLQVGWIFDINFTVAFSAVRSRRFLEKIEAALPASDQLKKMFEMTRNYLNTRILKGDSAHRMPELDGLFMP